jgi:hypothetical protein
VRIEPEPARCFSRQLHLLHGPFGSRRRIAAHSFGREAIHRQVVGRMHRNELPLQVGRQLGDLKAELAQRAAHFIAVGVALRGAFKVEQLRCGGWHLHALVAERAAPRPIASSELNGAASPANCARKMPGPWMLFMCWLLFEAAICRASLQSTAAPGLGR